MIADCTAIILAGGESRRMGRDKAMLPLQGWTLLQTVSARLAPLFGQTLLSVREPRNGIALPQICDAQAGGGPLVGVISALEQVGTGWAFVVACDMPFISPEVVAWLAGLRAQHQAVVPQVGGYAQPLAAFYSCSALPFLRAHLAGGGRSLIGALTGLDVRYVAEDELLALDPQLRSFFDLDTPQDVAIAERMEVVR